MKTKHRNARLTAAERIRKFTTKKNRKFRVVMHPLATKELLTPSLGDWSTDSGSKLVTPEVRAAVDFATKELAYRAAIEVNQIVADQQLSDLRDQLATANTRIAELEQLVIKLAGRIV